MNIRTLKCFVVIVGTEVDAFFNLRRLNGDKATRKATIADVFMLLFVKRHRYDSVPALEPATTNE